MRLQQVLSFTSPLYSASFQNPSPKQARELLLNAWLASRKLAFDYAPLKRDEIEQFAASQGKIRSVFDLARVFSSTKSSQLEEKLSAMVDAPAKTSDDAVSLEPAKKQKGSPAEFAFSYYVYCLLSGIFARPQFKPAPAKEIRLVANFGGWTAVRKVSLERGEKKEAVACCAIIFESVRKKLHQYLCAEGKQAEFDALSSTFFSKFPERKSFARVPEILSEAEKEIPAIRGLAEKGFEGQLLDLFYSLALERVGYPPFISTDQVSRIYPDLKIPKPRGRTAGAGKKEQL